MEATEDLVRGGAGWLVAAVIAIVGCSGGGPSGSSGIPIGGTYTATHMFTVNTLPAACPGSLTLTGSGSFSGLLRVSACDVFGGEALEFPISGAVTSGGALTFTFVGGLSLGDILDQLGCVVTSSDSGFTGTFDDGAIDVTTMAAVQSCPDIPGAGDVVWRIQATRQS